MHCSRCNTPLWKVRSRECPECGTPFKPSGFRFRPRTVRFCCPHCGQGYLGNGPDGLPEPRKFECVFCGRWVHADQMVLELADGVAEHQARPDSLPWVETHRPRVMRWGLTAWLGVRDPELLLRLTPVSLGRRPALAYAAVTLVGGALGLVAAAWMAGVVLSLPGGSRAFGALTVGGLARLVAQLAVSAGFAAAWIAIIHAAARRAGCRAPLDRAVQAVCLTCVPHVLWFAPAVGGWIGWLGTLAWARAAARALVGSHGLPRRPAGRAGLGWPIACLVVWAGLSWAAGLGVLPRWGTGPAAWHAAAAESVSRFRRPIRDFLADGRPLRHAAELMADGGISPADFSAPNSQTSLAGIELAGVSLAEFEQLAPARRLAVIQQAADQLPAGTRAHRLGDFVFLLDAIGRDEGGLWIVAEAFDPAQNAANGPVHVLHTDGSVRSIPGGRVGPALLEQNRLRATLGLPMLDDPRRLRPGSVQPGG